MIEISAKQLFKVKPVAPSAGWGVEGTEGGSFAIAIDRKELKLLMQSDADVVYDESKVKLSLNENCSRFRGKPELSTDYIEGLAAHDGDAMTGDGGGQNGDIKSGKKEDYIPDKAELGAALDAMNDAGAFIDVKLIDAALTTLMGNGGAVQQGGGGS